MLALAMWRETCGHGKMFWCQTYPARIVQEGGGAEPQPETRPRVAKEAGAHLVAIKGAAAQVDQTEGPVNEPGMWAGLKRHYPQPMGQPRKGCTWDHERGCWVGETPGLFPSGRKREPDYRRAKNVSTFDAERSVWQATKRTATERLAESQAVAKRARGEVAERDGRCAVGISARRREVSGCQAVVR